MGILEKVEQKLEKKVGGGKRNKTGRSDEKQDAKEGTEVHREKMEKTDKACGTGKCVREFHL